MQQFFIKKEVANSIEAMLPIAAKVKDRPILAGVLIELAPAAGGTQFTFTVTDSYRLVRQTFINENEVAESTSVLVDAKQLLDALRKVRGRNPMTIFELPNESGVAFRVTTNTGAVCVTDLKLVDGTYPNLEHIYSGVVDHERVASFNPDYLAEMPKAMGAAKSRVPVGLALSKSAETKPASLVWKNPATGIESFGLIMPVRI